MSNLEITNISGEEFKFFLDEEFTPVLRVTCKMELLAEVRMCKEDLNAIRKWINDNYDSAE